MRVIGRGLYVESLMAGTHEVHGRTQGKFLLIKLKKCFLHLTAGTRRLYLRTEGSASLFCEKIIHPVDSWDPSDLVTDLWAY